MALFKAPSPNSQVIGSIIIALAQGMGAFEYLAEMIMKKHNLTNIDSNQWYPHQQYLDSFQEIMAKTGPNTIIQMGRRIGKKIAESEHLSDIQKAVSSLNENYASCHHNAANPWLCTIHNNNTITIVNSSPYPTELITGQLRGIVEHFYPQVGKVVLDETKPCKKKGADSDTFLLSW